MRLGARAGCLRDLDGVDGRVGPPGMPPAWSTVLVRVPYENVRPGREGQAGGVEAAILPR